MSNINNMIISGVRIFLPSDGVLPTPSNDMITFGVILNTDFDFDLMVHIQGLWQRATPKTFTDIAYAISAATKIAKRQSCY